jgi:hypothetical protein
VIDPTCRIAASRRIDYEIILEREEHRVGRMLMKISVSMVRLIIRDQLAFVLNDAGCLRDIDQREDAAAVNGGVSNRITPSLRICSYHTASQSYLFPVDYRKKSLRRFFLLLVDHSPLWFSKPTRSRRRMPPADKIPAISDFTLLQRIHALMIRA